MRQGVALSPKSESGRITFTSYFDLHLQEHDGADGEEGALPPIGNAPGGSNKGLNAARRGSLPSLGGKVAGATGAAPGANAAAASKRQNVPATGGSRKGHGARGWTGRELYRQGVARHGDVERTVQARSCAGHGDEWGEDCIGHRLRQGVTARSYGLFA